MCFSKENQEKESTNRNQQRSTHTFVFIQINSEQRRDVDETKMEKQKC